MAEAPLPDETQEFLLTPRQILTSNKPALVAAWKKLDRSGFEFDSKTDYQLALLRRHYSWSDEPGCTPRVARNGPQLASTTSNELPRQLTAFPPSSHVSSSPPNTPISFKQAVTGAGKSHLPSAQSDQLKTRAAQTKLPPKKHQPQEPASRHKPREVRQYNTQLQQLNRDLRNHEDAIEDLARSARSKNLVLYGVPEEVDGVKLDVQSLVSGVKDLMDSTQRLGRLPTNPSKPRPLRFCFNTLRSKHEFLSCNAKALRENLGIRCDDDLTRKQQQQREELSADFLN